MKSDVIRLHLKLRVRKGFQLKYCTGPIVFFLLKTLRALLYFTLPAFIGLGPVRGTNKQSERASQPNQFSYKNN